MKLSFAITLLLLTLISCSPKNADKPAGVLTDGQQKALEQAKEVEKTLQEENEKRLKAIDGIDNRKEE